MQYAAFANTGIEVSRLSVGTAPFGGQTDEAASQLILDRAKGAGLNFVDTADAYPMPLLRGLVVDRKKL